VLVQRARVRADVGDVLGARRDAVDAQRQFSGDEDDPTVSALVAATGVVALRRRGSPPATSRAQ
jgi:hypothetical protein